MRYIWSHINTILHQYKGQVPLSPFLRNYFRSYPKLGSRDRKILAEMAYVFYRCGKALKPETELEKKLMVCLFLCETSVPHILNFIPESWKPIKHLPLEEKIRFLEGQEFHTNLEKIPGFEPELSAGITVEAWIKSMLVQPDLFIRLRNNQEPVQGILKKNKIEFNSLSPSCLSLPNSTKLEDLIPPSSYVVQDASSQVTGHYFHPKAGEEWWDCCSGAGGKSLLLKDLEPGVVLTVSDKRSSVLQNLMERFRLYGHQPARKLTMEISDPALIKKNLGNQQFDHIICDVPCTGSGTWARTPEQLYFFEPETILEYAERQKKITSLVTPYLKRGGSLIYITCSVFKKENEDVVNYLEQNLALKKEELSLINGVRIRADSMFVSVLRKI